MFEAWQNQTSLRIADLRLRIGGAQAEFSSQYSLFANYKLQIVNCQPLILSSVFRLISSSESAWIPLAGARVSRVSLRTLSKEIDLQKSFTSAVINGTAVFP